MSILSLWETFHSVCFPRGFSVAFDPAIKMTSAMPGGDCLLMNYLSGKTVSLIGGTGFVGRALAGKLLKAGAQVIILARNAERAKRLKTGGAIGQLTAIAGNAQDDADLFLLFHLRIL